MEQNQTDYFSLTQIRACNLQALFFFTEREICNVYYGEKQLQHYYIWR